MMRSLRWKCCRLGIAAGAAAGGGAQLLADGTLTLEIGAWSGIGTRVNDSSLQPSTVCGGATATATANSNVPYALVKISCTGTGPISVRAETLNPTSGPASGFDPFLGAYCAAPPVTLLLTADDDSGGYPTALLSGARGLSGSINKKYYLLVSSFSARPEKRYGKVKLTVTGPATIQKCIGDVNYDGIVDDTDFSVFVRGYDLLLCTDATMIAGCPADLNGDGLVDDADFSLFIGGYNTLLCP